MEISSAVEAGQPSRGRECFFQMSTARQILTTFLLKVASWSLVLHLKVGPLIQNNKFCVIFSEFIENWV